SGNQTSNEVRADENGDSSEEENPILAQIPDKESLLAQIPKTPAAINALKEELEIAYFEMGKLLFFDFKEPKMSIEYLEGLITSYPNSNKKAEAYYILFLANQESGGNEKLYAERLNREFPESPFTFSVNNPDGIKGNQAFLESSKLYKDAYDLYYQREYVGARSVIRNTLENFPLTKNTEKLLLLDIMISGKIDDKERYKGRLENYIQVTENQDLVKMARNMLLALTGDDVKEEQKTDQLIAKDEDTEETPVLGEIEEEDEEDSPYRENPNQTHIFVIALEPEKAKDAKNLLADLEAFHMQNFASARLRTGNMNLSREEAIFIVSPFSNAEKALDYRNKFMNSFNSASIEDSDKENCFLISIEYLQELNRRYNLIV
ncbi:MAG: gliding motility protein, partial [Cyclobacteriaceae bacterium]|nr:gliding motility protein [Cyclobacteriaceae bacterium]